MCERLGEAEFLKRYGEPEDFEEEGHEEDEMALLAMDRLEHCYAQAASSRAPSNLGGRAVNRGSCDAKLCELVGRRRLAAGDKSWGSAEGSHVVADELIFGEEPVRAGRRRGRQQKQTRRAAAEQVAVKETVEELGGEHGCSVLVGNRIAALAADPAEELEAVVAAVVLEGSLADTKPTAVPRLAVLQAEEAGILYDVQGMEGIVIQTPFLQSMFKAKSEWCMARRLVLRAALEELGGIGRD